MTDFDAEQGKPNMGKRELTHTHTHTMHRHHTQTPYTLAHTPYLDTNIPYQLSDRTCLALHCIRNGLQQQLGVKLPSSLMFDYPTMKAGNFWRRGLQYLVFAIFAHHVCLPYELGPCKSMTGAVQGFDHKHLETTWHVQHSAAGRKCLIVSLNWVTWTAGSGRGGPHGPDRNHRNHWTEAWDWSTSVKGSPEPQSLGHFGMWMFSMPQ